MEYIKKIEISNYKSIEHLVIEDCRKFNLLIGYPNVGKSNILEALSLISQFAQKENINKFCRFQSYFNLFHLGNIEEPIVVTLNDRSKLEFRVINKLNYLTSFYKKDEKGDYAKFDSPYNTHFYIKKYHFKEGTKNINSNEKYLDIPYGENLITIFQLNKELRKEAASILNLYDLILNVDIEKSELRLQKYTSEDTILSIPYELVADTIQRILFYSAAILSNENSILLFEEPEAHLFPPYIKRMIANISNDERGNQYFINTHSPYVLETLIEDKEIRDQLSIYIVYHKGGESKIKRVDDKQLIRIAQYGNDLFFNLENFIN